VFGGLVVWMFEGMNREIPMLPIMLLALAFTALIFAPFLHLEQWLLRRSKKARGHQHLY
jgi:hypothetical protein